MKRIGISDEVYLLLLEEKHKLEKKNGEVMGFDRIIRFLIESVGGEERDGNH